eukprot:gene18962-38121_t
MRQMKGLRAAFDPGGLTFRTRPGVGAFTWLFPLPETFGVATLANLALSAELMTIPLFPLGSVLCPGGSLPLRIFEVRYLDMVGKCHKAGTPFGIVALTQGHEVRKPGQGPVGDGFAHEAFNAVGTLVEI